VYAVRLGKASSTRGSRATCCPRHSVTLLAEVFEMGKSFNPFSSKAEVERRRNFENLRAVYLGRDVTLLICFIKMC
jgi:hypothetical protein